MNVFSTAGAVSAVLLCCVLAMPGIAADVPTQDRFVDPLDLPAPVTSLVSKTQMAAVTDTGKRLVAVGVRGLIAVSDDSGEHWSQVPAPVSSDLLAVQFPTPSQGWIVGQDGVVLHSADGGSSWTKQLDGRMAADLLKQHFESLAAGGDATAARYLDELALNYENGPEQSLMGLWFADERNGFVCGSFGTLLATRDGGNTWESWVERVESEQPLHYNAVLGVGSQVYLASERGIVFRLDAAAQRFIARETGYGGTFFGLAGSGGRVIAFGMRGTAYRSDDDGDSWQALSTGVGAALNGGRFTPDGALLLVTQNGQLIRSTDGGDHFERLPLARPMLLSGVSPAGKGQLVIAGRNGLQRVPLAPGDAK